MPILIPNVFEVIADIFISQLNFQPWLYEIVIRLILFVVDALALSNFFYWITFACVGNFYDSGSNPVWGSICYTIYYFIHMFIPVLLIQHFTWLAIILTFVIYALISAIFYFVSSKLDTLSDSWIFRLILHCVIWTVVLLIVKYIAESTTNFSFDTNTLKIGKASLSLREIERISFLLAHDLKTFADTNGDTSTLSANAVYAHLRHIQ